MTNSTPLVSCIMPTGDRRIFARKAIEYWFCQTYPNLELIIVDGGRERFAHELIGRSRSIQGRVAVLDELSDNATQQVGVGGISGHRNGIRYVRVDPKTTAGWRRNAACGMATGEYIVHFDDDDYQFPQRVEKQVEALAFGFEAVQTSELYAWDVERGFAIRWPSGDGDKPEWVHGASLAYPRTTWLKHRFEDVNYDDDIRFVRAVRADGGRVVDMLDPELLVWSIHGRNVSKQQRIIQHRTAELHANDTAAVLQKMAPSAARFYSELAELFRKPEPSSSFDAWNVGAEVLRKR